MKKLNITKEQFDRSRYFQRKYGKLEYVSESGNLYKTNKGKVLRFNESADQTPEDIIDNIVTLSILERDAESAEAMFQDLKQELFNMGLLSGQIHEDFDDFHDIAIDFAEHHNFNKQFVEQAAVTLKSEIERGLSGTENMESTKKFNEEITYGYDNKTTQRELDAEDYEIKYWPVILCYFDDEHEFFYEPDDNDCPLYNTEKEVEDVLSQMIQDTFNQLCRKTYKGQFKNFLKLFSDKDGFKVTIKKNGTAFFESTDGSVTIEFDVGNASIDSNGHALEWGF